ncbi:alpha/beta fold hydrolase [Streptomyces sp. NPDC023723]|uniref:thioesterase II family protein n=1 Tax=Streptomyces sp. NPDC023723 TaxID=3154323 RepID=UPI0034063BFF
MTAPASTVQPLLTCHAHHGPAPRTRLVCFPHAGAPGTFFSSWLHALPAHVELVTVRYAPHGPEENLTGLAARAARELAGLPGRPSALFGHSMGAVVAYETARAWEGLGRLPLPLFVSGAPSPGGHRPDDLHLREEDELVRVLRRLGGTAAEILDDPELRAVWLPDIRRDFRLLDTYRHLEGPPLRCPVTALTGREDPEAPLDSVRRWRSYTASSFELCTFPGGHFYLVEEKERLVGEVLRRLTPGGAASAGQTAP